MNLPDSSSSVSCQFLILEIPLYQVIFFKTISKLAPLKACVKKWSIWALLKKKSNFSRHFKGWKFIRLCILCYIFVFLHQLFLSLPLWSICFDKFYKKNCICEVGIYFIFRNPYIALSIKVSRRRRKEIFVWKSEEKFGRI